MNDPINHPDHYTVAGEKYESIKIIDDWRLGFSLGNAVKYILRAPHKGNELEDLKKALWYLEHATDVGERPQLSFRKPHILPHEVARAWELSTDAGAILLAIYKGSAGSAEILLRCMLESHSGDIE